MKNDCKLLEENILDYARLGRAKREEVDAHLRECESCRQLFEECRELDQLFIDIEPEQAPVDFAGNVMGTIQQRIDMAKGIPVIPVLLVTLVLEFFAVWFLSSGMLRYWTMSVRFCQSFYREWIRSLFRTSTMALRDGAVDAWQLVRVPQGIDWTLTVSVAVLLFGLSLLAVYEISQQDTLTIDQRHRR